MAGLRSMTIAIWDQKTLGLSTQNKINGQQRQNVFETTGNTEGTEKRRTIMEKFLCNLCVLCGETPVF